ncbi:MAG: hypothetical protein AB4426_16320 [Xenococcaceae cyanobacterium]
MLFLTAEELEIQSVSGQDTSEIIFQNKLLTRGPDYPINNRDKASIFCQQNSEDDFLCLLVENPYYLTVWLEKKSETSISPTEPESPPPHSSSVQKRPLKKDQGISYYNRDEFDNQPELESPPIHNPSPQKRSTRQYRGVYY